METKCKTQYNEEVVHVLASFIAYALLDWQYTHGYANEDEADSHDDSRDSREMVNQEIQVSLVSPAKDVEKCVDKSMYKDDPAAVDVQFM